MRYRFGGFEFDTRSGLLTIVSTDATGEPEYLAPQPAHLLELLLENAPDLVTREEIARRLWPDVEVEVEQGLHHCIRQIRQALGDSASEERFVRTIHRRGYAFAAPVEIVAEPLPLDGKTSVDVTEEEGRRTEILPHTTRRKFTIAVGLVALFGALAIGVSTIMTHRAGNPESAHRIRVAVMSFRPREPADPVRTVAERLVIRLTGITESPYEVIGPSTTEPFEHSADGLSRLVDELEVDFILNGRFVPDSSGFVLAEIIRGTDGVHLWAKYLDLSRPDSVLADAIEHALRSRTEGDQNR